MSATADDGEGEMTGGALQYFVIRINWLYNGKYMFFPAVFIC